PFQPLIGSHTSNLISESSVGFATPFTSQWAGRVTVGPGGVPGRVAVNGFSGTTVEEVIVVCDSFKVLRLSHDCWATADGANATAARIVNDQTNKLLRMMTPGVEGIGWAENRRFERELQNEKCKMKIANWLALT